MIGGKFFEKQTSISRHNEHQIGYLEDKAHKARIRKHGSNYLLETYLKGLPDAVDPTTEENPGVDKNSDSGVVTEGDSEQSNPNKPTCNVQVNHKTYLILFTFLQKNCSELLYFHPINLLSTI